MKNRCRLTIETSEETKELISRLPYGNAKVLFNLFAKKLCELIAAGRWQYLRSLTKGEIEIVFVPKKGKEADE